ncbi:MAG: DNA polymerase [Promethearchaeota archaeon]
MLSAKLNKEFKPELISLYERVGAIKPVKQKEYKFCNGLIVKNRRRFITSKNIINEIFAFDTETYRGTCRLLARSCGKETNYKTSYIHKPTFKECLDFLFYRASDSGIWRFFFNLDFDISAILKLWKNSDKIEKIKELVKGNPICYKDYTLVWLKSRMFILKKGKRRVVYTDLFNMFHSSLQKASDKFLKNESKDDIDGNKLNNSLKYWNDNLERIIQYCEKDCIITVKLAEILLEHLKKAKVEIPKYLVSSASLSKQDFRYNCYLTNISHVPLEIQEVALKAYYGGRFEVLKRGTIKQSYLYDINSQYPNFMKTLPSLKFGMWFPINYLPKKQCIAYFLATLNIPDDNLISTIPVKHKGVVKFPNGFVRKWCTWYDLDLMRDFIITIERGYIYKESPFEYRPLKERILFHYKQKAFWKEKNDLMYMLHKLTMNALYGCFVEINKKVIDGKKTLVSGMLFNSVYASQITAYGRWSVLKDVWNEKKHIIAIHTDSILIDKKIDLNIGKKIGEWCLESSGKTYIINTGMYQINAEKKLVKTRGIPIEYINDWFEFAKKNGSVKSREFKVKRMLKISQALIQDKHMDNVNIMFNAKKSVNINSDRKRCWFRDFKNFKDTLNDNIKSLPYIAIYDNDINELHPNPMVII